MNKKMDSKIIYALYGGHFNLFLECLKYRNHNIKHYHKLIITCLLRYNHVEQYKAYSLMMLTDPHYR